MARYGFTNAGANASGAIVEELMRRAVLEQQAQQMEMVRQREANDQQNAQRTAGQQDSRIQLDREQFEAQQAERERQITDVTAQKETAGRAAQNEAAVRDMIATRVEQGPLDQDTAKTIGMMGYREQMPVPGIIDQAMKPPPPDPNIARQAEIEDYETKKRIDAKYRQQDAPQQDNEPLVAIMGPDGQPVLVPRRDAAGKRPASTREQGRPVTSSDAGRMADFDTSLHDLETLAETLTATKGATGTQAAIGAAVPNVVTEFTGWGTDAKKRQGTINRVKQVIGKVLEGGVLRKEDEAKYEKILPTIYDTAEVAASKLAGLKTAIEQRRGTFLENLGDAGYETGKFNGGSGGGSADGGVGQEYDYVNGKLVPRR